MGWTAPEWFEWEREATVHPIAWFLEGVTVDAREFFGRGWPDTYLFYRNDVVFWINKMDELCSLGQFLIDFLGEPRNFRKLEERLAADTRKLKTHFGRIGSLHLQTLSDAQLLELHGEFYARYKEWAVAVSINEPVYLQGEVLLRRMLEGEEKLEQKLSILATCSRKSFSVRQECDLLKIAVEEGITADDIESEMTKNETLKRKLEEHAHKYFWLQNGYLKTTVLTAGYFGNELKALLKENDAQKYLKELDHSLVARNKEKEELMDSLGFNQKQRRVVEIVDYNAWLQDYRKEVILEASHYLDILLGEISRRAQVPLEEAKYALGSEVGLLLEKKITRETLERRRKECVLYVLEKEGKCRILEGGEARGMEQRLLQRRRNVSEIVELQGTTANPGKVQGRACVTMNPAEANRALEKGDVLVTSMTTPDFAQAIKRAAAIVANEGGITSHAAIISREFGIPCVVGTRIATKALKTGDWVEVDGNHGKVRKMVK